MPKKIRQLKQALRSANWVLVPGGKGSHTKWQHLGVPRTVILAGSDGEDASPKKQRDIDEAVNQAREAEQESA